MFGTIQQVLEAYEAELTKYRGWTEKLKAEYAPDTQFMAYNEQDYRRILEWNAELKGMEKALGLDKEEVKRISKKVGILT